MPQSNLFLMHKNMSARGDMHGTNDMEGLGDDTWMIGGHHITLYIWKWHTTCHISKENSSI